MKLLRNFATGILTAGVALAAAGGAKAQNGQQSSQQTDGTTGSSTTPQNTNLPYNPPAPPPGGTGDAATGRYTGQGTTGYGSGGVGSTQSGSSGNSNGIGHIGSNTAVADDVPENQLQLEQQQARARNADRQKQLVADTQKLVALANELEDEVSKSNKDMLSLDVVRKADEIDKLAKNVRDKMKNAD